MENNKNLSINVIINCQDAVIERDEQCFKLDPLQLRLVEFFLTHPDQIISRQTLAEQVWHSTFTSDDAINRTISILRKALATQRDLFIATIPKVGYRFSVAEHVSLKVHSRAVFEVDQSFTESAVEAQDIVLNETSDKGSNKSSTVRLWSLLGANGWLIAGAVVITIVITLATGYWSSMSSDKLLNGQSGDQRGAQRKPVKQNTPVTLAVANIELAPTDQLPSTFTEVLREQILKELFLVEGFGTVNTSPEQYKRGAVGNDTQATVLLNGKLLILGETVKLTLQLVDIDSGNRLFSTVIDASMKDKQTLLSYLGEQVVAAVRLSLLHRSSFKRYAPALKRLSHVEVEQLILASNHVMRKRPKGLEKALDILERINKNKPDTPQVLGLLASTHIAASNRISGQYISSKHQVLSFAQQALALQPSNLDALLALSHYYITIAHLKHKASHVISAMLSYHPDEPRAWRFRLYSMVTGARPCSEIRQFVDSIPPGLFTYFRLKVIRQILDTCETTQPSVQAEQLWQQRKMGKNGKTHKAMHRSMYLFKRANDITLQVQQSRLNLRPSPILVVQMYQTKLAMGDIAGAHIIWEDIKRSATDYWLRSANLVAKVYNQSALQAKTPVGVQDYSLLDKGTNLYVVANLVKNAEQPQLLEYLEHRPEFEAELYNREETLALMMAQRAVGRLEASRQTARRLSKQLTRYRNNSPQSYFFWNLGKVHLISDLYCGADCQQSAKQQPSQQLAQMFEPSHRWWTDDIGILRIALEPWADEPLVKAYFDRIEKDRQRVKARLGI